MADRPIIQIDLDDKKFVEFVDKWQKYRDDVKKAPKDFEALNKATTKWTDRVEMGAESIGRIGWQMSDPRFGRPFQALSKVSYDTAKSWKEINNHLKTANVRGSSFLRMFVGSGRVGMLGAGAVLGVTAGLFGGAARSSSNLSEQNLRNRSLSISSGQEKAWEYAYGEKYGVHTDLLEKAANLKQDMTKWGEVQGAGIGPDEISGMTTTQLAQRILSGTLKNIGQFSEAEQGPMLQATGLDKYVSLDQFRAMKSYGPGGDLAGARDNFDSFTKSLQLNQKSLDEATKAHQRFEVAWDRFTQHVEEAFTKLADPLSKVTDKFSELLTAFVSGPEFEKDIQSVEEVFRRVAGWLGMLKNDPNASAKSDTNDDGSQKTVRQQIGDYLENVGKSPQVFKNPDGSVPPEFSSPLAGKTGQDPVDRFVARAVLGVIESIDTMTHPNKYPKYKFTGDAADLSPEEALKVNYVTPRYFRKDPLRESHMGELEAQYRLPPGWLNASEGVESSFGTRNINEDNPNVLGTQQFDRATAKAYGVNRFDQYSSNKGAAKKYADLYAKYHDWSAARAAYGGFAGLDDDIKKYGSNWRAHMDEFQPSGTSRRDLTRMEGYLGRGLNDPSPTVVQGAVQKANQAQGNDQGVRQTPLNELPPVTQQPGGVANVKVPTVNVAVTAPPGFDVAVSLAGLLA